MAIEQVKTINELERLTEVSDDNAFAVSAGNVTGSATAKIIETYLEQYLEKLANKVNQITSDATNEQYPSAKAVYDALATINSVKAGTIIAWSTATAPAGYLICDGSAVSRTTYAALFAVIGTAYGAGDGNSTFNLPNLYDRIPWQSAALTAGNVGLGAVPNITGTFVAAQSPNIGETDTGAFTNTFLNQQSNQYRSSEVYHFNYTHTFDASRSSTVYGTADRVIPAYLTMSFCIKY